MTRRLTNALVGTAALFAAANAGAAIAPHVQGELIVKLKAGAEKNFFANKNLGVEKIEKISQSLHLVRFNQAKSLESVQQTLNNDANVEYSEPNFIYTIVNPEKFSSLDNLLVAKAHESALTYTPTDPKYGELWGLANNGANEPGRSGGGVVGADIDALKAWEITRGDRAVKIAVIDTGIEYSHPDLRDNMWVNEAEQNGEAGVDDDGNGFVDDIHGYDFANNDGDPNDGHSHGTHCAGTIGAVHNNGEGVAGVMANVTLVAVKFLTDSGSGTTANAIKSIDYATTVGVDLMSNSWGGGGFSQALKDSIVRASEAGIIFTAAAGNSSSNNDQGAHYPSNYDVANVVSVAASTAQDGLASFSSYGRRTVHIAAPGHNIMSTVKNGSYKSYSGTSMATPHVSGTVGLLLAENGRMDHAEMKERLMATSEPLATLRGKTINGGRLNAYNLLTDTRPQRNDPKPGEWKRVVLDEVWESAHPYIDNANIEKQFNIPGAKFIRLRIKKYELEKRYDFIQVSGSSRAVVEKVSGKGAEYVTDFVEGETLFATFKSDRSVTKWGFIVEEIEYQ